MKTKLGHLTYCTNIHAGRNWAEDFQILQQHYPEIKQSVSAGNPLGIGLRLSHSASLELQNEDKLAAFIAWLKAQNAYVFTMNGFPYGEFHHTVVKADVHTPDWTSAERREYTIRLFKILSRLLPDEQEGGISTSPLSYRHWFKTPEDLKAASKAATLNIIAVLKTLVHIGQQTGKYLHLDLEPEPDGIIETGQEYIAWFEQELLVLGIPEIVAEFQVSAADAEALLKKHLCLCYDVCHFSIGYENHQEMIAALKAKGLRVGKIQISAALKANLQTGIAERQAIKNSFEEFNEPTYLHQVVALKEDGTLLRYPDLPEALADFDHAGVKDWRAHFHVPVALTNINVLQTTQSDIIEVLKLQKEYQFTNHLEVETYTWEVLPEAIKLPISTSISKELNWVNNQIDQL